MCDRSLSVAVHEPEIAFYFPFARDALSAVYILHTGVRNGSNK